MLNARVEMIRALGGAPEVRAGFDLAGPEVAAVAHAVGTSRTEQFRLGELSADAVLALRELTALADELSALAAHGSACTLTLSPARLIALRDTLDAFVAARDEAGFVREEDREAYGIALALAGPLSDLSADTLRAALDAAEPLGC